MKISFIGLSCFMIENASGYRILVDPFNADPGWSLGPKFPENFDGKRLGANIVIMTEPDADHAYTPGDFLQHAPATKPGSNPFPGLDLRGTVVYEYNGDLNVAYHYTVDGLRLLHLADNAHPLNESQLAEIGQPDIIFVSPPKTERSNETARESLRRDIENLKPKLIVWAHHIAPHDLPDGDDSQTLQNYFIEYFATHANTNKFYTGKGDFIQLCYIYENALILNREYNGSVPEATSIVVDRNYIDCLPKTPSSILFKKMLAL